MATKNRSNKTVLQTFGGVMSNLISNLVENDYIHGQGVYYAGEIKSIKKSPDELQGLWEAITNSFESVAEKGYRDNYITIRFIYTENALCKDLHDFCKLEVEDNGVGFDDTNFERFIQLKDDRKSAKNRGSGRIQLLHTFDVTEYNSVFVQEGIQYKRSFILSKASDFIQNNAIIRYIGTEKSENEPIKTLMSCSGVLGKNKNFDQITATEFKKEFISHYLPLLCSIRANLPRITIECYLNEECTEKEEILAQDIPIEDKTSEVTINYSRFNSSNNIVEKTTAEEKFTFRCFKLLEEQLPKNKISIISKGEIVPGVQINFDLLKENDCIDKHRYLVFLEGQYFDDIAGDTRGNLPIPSNEDLKNNEELFQYDQNYITLENISSATNAEVKKHYPEIVEKEKEFLDELAGLEKMFLLDREAMKHSASKLGLNATPEKILKSLYELDSSTAAKADAKIKYLMDELKEIKPTSDNYEIDLGSRINELVKMIPLQNRTDITHYVARRKIVLEVFQKALDRELEMQKNAERNIDEKILHNILFQQSSEDPSSSDLWIINEDFIYFNGCSENKLFDIKIDGERIFRDEFSAEEEAYLNSLGEDRKKKRPDVLLFPEEGKCIILEFKNPNVNVSDYLHQITKYGTWLGKYTKDKYFIHTVYGYLIGEAIEAEDVLSADSRYIEDPKFKFLVKPSDSLYFGKERGFGSIYSEVIKYSVLLERAKKRNEIFINKLLKRHQ